MRAAMREAPGHEKLVLKITAVAHRAACELSVEEERRCGRERCGDAPAVSIVMEMLPARPTTLRILSLLFAEELRMTAEAMERLLLDQLDHLEHRDELLVEQTGDSNQPPRTLTVAHFDASSQTVKAELTRSVISN